METSLMPQIWKPIEDLPSDWNALTDGELGPLLQFWNDQRADLEQSGALKTFSERLAREWSIETGQIEGVYNIDRGITQTLIERGINADLIPREPGQKDPSLVAAIIRDHYEVLEGLFQFVKGERSLSKSYINQLHEALLRHQDTSTAVDQFGNVFEAKLLKGAYKQRPNNPITASGTMHQYCPPEQVDPEMERLLAMHSEHTKNAVPIEVEAAWLHHRFTQIHPYQDGNGRVARALASLLFIKEGWFPVVVTREDRRRYIDALEIADSGDLGLLVSFFVDTQKRSLFQAVRTATDIQPVHSVDEAINAARLVLESTGKNTAPGNWQKVKHTADRLMNIATSRLQEVCEALKREIGKSRPELQCQISDSPSCISGTMLREASTTEYVQAQSLLVSTQKRGGLQDHQTHIEIHAYVIGDKARGLIGFTAVFNDSRSTAARAPTNFGFLPPVEPASKESFQVNYAESYESTERRFRPWLEESLVNALNMWRKSL